ncbi:MAG: hypothetical protein M3Q73_00735 [bacterium]|nr:hypothetical protein [bacterium]
MYSFFKGRYTVLYTLLVIVALIILFFAVRKDTYNNDSAITIILAPHTSDVMTSVSDLISLGKDKTIAAVFFVGNPEAGTTTLPALTTFKHVELRDFAYTDPAGNDQASLVQTDISKDIQTLIASAGDKKIKVYAPALYTAEITHPAHALLHNAFIDVVRSYPNENVEFYIYEDQPYAGTFFRSSPMSLQRNLENTSGLVIEKVDRYYRVSPY